MTVYEVGYCTREEVKRALDLKHTARANLLIDRAIEASARDIDGSMHRVFYPTDDTRYFDWPNYQYANPWRLWLKDNELATWPPVSVLAGTQPLDTSHIFPGPWQTKPGPPWTFFELDRSSALAFGGNAQTPQRSIVVQGTFGFTAVFDAVTTLSAAISTAGATTALINDSSHVAPGIVILVDSERMLVQDAVMSATGLTLSGSGVTTNVASDTTLTTSGSGSLNLYETILIDSERMLVVDTTAAGGYVLKRAYDGTVLATHVATAPIWATRTLTVQRGALGTTAATHSNNASVSRLRAPSAIRDLNIGLAEVQLTGEPSAWAAQAQAGSTSKHDVPGAGLHLMWCKAENLYRRKTLILAI